MKFDNLESLKLIISECSTKHQVIKKLGYSKNSYNYNKLNKVIKDYNIDISHFNNSKVEKIKKLCPVCSTEFETKKNHKKEKTVCSKSCSNTFFRSGENNPLWNPDSYRSTCFQYHEKKCIICGEDKAIDVHHLDENNKNNSPENLIVLCPNHHRYWHTKYKYLIEDEVYTYINNFIKENNL